MAGMTGILQDIRYGVRQLRKRPGFTLVAVLTLALGIGANTTIFSVMNATLLKSLSFPDSERLVRADSEPEVYMSYLQDPFQWPYLSLLVRTTSNPVKLFPAIEQAVWSVDKDQPLSNPITLNQARSHSIAQPRVAALLLARFAGAALLLAAVGLDGVVSYWVAERTHEIGVRMALGARSFDVFSQVVGRGLILALLGTAIGLTVSLAATRMLASFLFAVRSTDPLTFAAVALLLMGVALVASYFPARRAAKVDSMVVLRYE